jgi:hypothetical protein
MDLPTIITTILSSGVISLGAARWMTSRLVEHRLAKDLRSYQARIDEKLAAGKAQFDKELVLIKAEFEAQLRRQVEEYLADQAAERQYSLEARKRLYTAIGPLRFQLTSASADFVYRISRIGGGQSYPTSLNNYFGQSTTFRLLRLFAISELIERQMAHFDFSADPSTRDLLRFKHSAFRCLSSSTVSLNHPSANWDAQVEHIYHDTISIISGALIVNEEGKGQRIMNFDEFSRYVSEPKKLGRLKPIPSIMENFSIPGKPIFWLRLVALAQLCSVFVASEGPRMGIVPEEYNGLEMLKASADQFILSNLDRYREVLSSLAPRKDDSNR